jgi:hypothetical protein
VACITALAFLLTYVIWRLVMCCTCCACVHGPQHHGKKARKLLGGRGAGWLKAAAAAMAAGVLAGSIYGITQTEREMVGGGLAAIDVVTAFIDGALDAGTAIVSAVQDLDTQLLAVKDALNDLGPAAAPTVAPYIQASGFPCMHVTSWPPCRPSSAQ